MRQFKIVRYVLTLLLYGMAYAFTSNVALAQFQPTTMQVGCPGDGAACPDSVVVAVNGAYQVLKNQPYEAQALTEIGQTLADGSHINQTSTAKIARDSEGRTVHTQELSNGETFTVIFDPVAKTTTKYNSDTKIAHVMTLPATLPAGATLATGGGFAVAAPATVAVGQVFVHGHAGSLQGFEKLDTTTESLGTKAIDGIQVSGTRSTNTIPAGAIGNDQAIIITRETWYSAALKLNLLSIHDDPRFGHTTYSLTNIQLGEPEAALFQVPPDYKVETIAMPQPPS
jgi:hypothetical protein